MKSMRRRVEVDIVAATIILSGTLVLVFGVARVAAVRQLQLYISPDNGELRLFDERYGPERNSEHAEEWILRDFFRDKRNGVFVDIGANDYKRFSNTYYLDVERGWSGLAIEPQTKFAADYAKHRPRTTFVPLFVSDASNREAVLYVGRADVLASVSRDLAESAGGSAEAVGVRTTSLDDVLDRSSISQFDFLNIDIELAEPAALAGFSIERFKPALVCIEAHLVVRQKILDYFAQHGYVLVGKYLRVDHHNLWFAPLSG